MRDNCAPDGTRLNAVAFPGNVDPTQLSATITPSQFNTAAAVGWTPTTATTTVTQAVPDLSAGSLPVLSTGGFVGSSPIGVRSSDGFQTLSCTVPPPPSTSFTGCSGGTGSVDPGAQVSQSQSITNVSISVTEPGSGYTYSLQASPRVWASRLSGGLGQAGASGAAVVSLGNVTLSGNAAITVLNGNVNINGTLDVTGLTGAGITTPGGVAPNTTTQVTDPLQPFVPSSVTTSGIVNPPTCTITTNTTLSAGVYTCHLTIKSGVVILGPGVYQFDGGINVQGGQLTYSGPLGQGVLIYLPCRAGNGCNETATFASGAWSRSPRFLRRNR